MSMEGDQFQLHNAMAISPTVPQETRSQIVTAHYYMTKAYTYALLGIVRNTLETDPIHRMALDNLEALHGLLTEKLNKDAP